MLTGGTVQQRPTSEQELTTDQEEAGAAGKCCRAGCERAVDIVWTERTTNEEIRYCAEDAVEAFHMITAWLGDPGYRIRLEEHRAHVEEALGRGLYGTERGRLYRGTPGNMR